MLFNESRIRLLLPQISTFLKSWIPSVPVPSYEMSALVYYVGLIVETSFHLDRSVLSLFDCFMQLPRESLVRGNERGGRPERRQRDVEVSGEHHRLAHHEFGTHERGRTEDD